MRNPCHGGKPLPPYDPVLSAHRHDHHHDPHHDGHHHRHQPSLDGVISKTVFIRYDQLLDDINMQLDIVADTRPNEDGTPNTRIGNATTKYSTQFKRWIDKYLDMTKTHMAAYIVTMERKAVMNAHRDWDEAIIHLAFPPSWNETSFTPLADAIQQFIVNSVLKEFFVLTLTSKDPVTIDKDALATEAWREIKHLLVTRRPGTQGKVLHPF